MSIALRAALKVTPGLRAAGRLTSLDTGCSSSLPVSVSIRLGAASDLSASTGEG